MNHRLDLEKSEVYLVSLTFIIALPTAGLKLRQRERVDDYEYDYEESCHRERCAPGAGTALTPSRQPLILPLVVGEPAPSCWEGGG